MVSILQKWWIALKNLEMSVLRCRKQPHFKVHLDYKWENRIYRPKQLLFGGEWLKLSRSELWKVPIFAFLPHLKSAMGSRVWVHTLFHAWSRWLPQPKSISLTAHAWGHIQVTDALRAWSQPQPQEGIFMKNMDAESLHWNRGKTASPLFVKKKGHPFDIPLEYKWKKIYRTKLLAVNQGNGRKSPDHKSEAIFCTPCPNFEN